MPRKLKLLLLLPLAGALALAILLLGPLRRVRLAQLGSARIGHFVTAVEAYLCQAKAGLRSPSTGVLDLFYLEEQVCNREVESQWRARLRILPGPNLFHLVARILRRAGSLGRRHLIPAAEMALWGEANERALREHRGHLRVPEPALAAGDAFATGTAGGRPLVCFHVRDAAYLRASQPGMDYSYHDYRDWPAASFADAAHALTGQGYFLVRMGAVVEHPLPFTVPGVFDYPLSGLRSDGLDLYFASRCAFWVGTASGLLDLPWAFRRPMVVLNHVSPLLREDPRITLYPDSVWTFKKFWSEARGRLLSLREIVDSGVGALSTGTQFRAAGIRFVDNSAAEVRDAVLEMSLRLRGEWNASPQDEALQDRFWRIWGPAWPDRARAARCRVATRFLSSNPELLD